MVEAGEEVAGRGGEEGAEDGDAECAADFADQVVDSGAGAPVAGGNGCDDGFGGRGCGEACVESGDELEAGDGRVPRAGAGVDEKTLGLVDAPTAVSAALSGTLLLGSGASHVAKTVSTRRADEAARAIRSGLGLPVARSLVRTTTVADWWFAAAVLTLLAWMGAAVGPRIRHGRTPRRSPAEPVLAVRWCSEWCA
ncbi:hypothetical protein ACIQVR_32625 [Streptomyces xanthochromogenes]|uniref:hypothetical protein n=1 Tax=Streptomyces xanthochromogenes TaxID=67384 RepID=UPI003826161D